MTTQSDIAEVIGCFLHGQNGFPLSKLGPAFSEDILQPTA
jgi:hypothetical protein